MPSPSETSTSAPSKAADPSPYLPLNLKNKWTYLVRGDHAIWNSDVSVLYWDGKWISWHGSEFHNGRVIGGEVYSWNLTSGWFSAFDESPGPTNKPLLVLPFDMTPQATSYVVVEDEHSALWKLGKYAIDLTVKPPRELTVGSNHFSDVVEVVRSMVATESYSPLGSPSIQVTRIETTSNSRFFARGVGIIQRSSYYHEEFQPATDDLRLTPSTSTSDETIASWSVL